jgi:hypothetical protein
MGELAVCAAAAGSDGRPHSNDETRPPNSSHPNTTGYQFRREFGPTDPTDLDLAAMEPACDRREHSSTLPVARRCRSRRNGACHRLAGGRKPKLTAGRPRWPAACMTRPATTAGESTPSPRSPKPSACPAKPSTGTSNHLVAAASPARPPRRPHLPGRWPRCRTRPMPASASQPPDRGLALLPRGPPWPARPAAANPPSGARRCSNAEDLAIVWLHLDGDYLTEARHCVACQPHGPVIDVSCSCCGNGPLITGQSPELGDQLAAPALDWLHARGWQFHPRPLCPADHR